MGLGGIVRCGMVIALASCGRLGFEAPADVRRSDAAMIDEDLVVWLPMDDDPAAGVTNAAGALVPTCAAAACPASAVGAIAGGYRFDGVDDMIAIAHDPVLELGGGTLALWVQANRVPAPGARIAFASKPYGSGGMNSFELFLRGLASSVDLVAGGDAVMVGFVRIPWTVASSTWVHLAMTWDSSMVRLYLDGGLLGEQGFQAAYDTHPFLIGVDSNASVLESFLDGSLDDLRVYRRPLDLDEIRALGQR